MAKQTSLFSGVAIGAVLTTGAWYASTQYDFTALMSSALIGTAEASVSAAPAPAPTVDVIRAEARSITEWDEFIGRFEAVDEVSIRARVTGHLDQVHFEAGEVVEKGDLLFTIDPRPYETALVEAQARVAEAMAAADLAQTELARALELSERGHVSQSVLDSRQQDADIANAAIASAQAAVARAQLNLDFTQIHAPVTGRISDDYVSQGNLVSAGATAVPLTTIVSLDPIHFVFDATEQQYLEYMRASETVAFRDAAGQMPVAVQLIDEVDFGHEGRIDFIDNSLDRATGTIRGRAVLDNDSGTLTPGMFGRMRMATALNSERVLIPDRAIGSDQATKFVWTVGADGTVTRRDVRLGDQHDGLRIVDGVAAGDQIVVSSLHMMGPGAQVTANILNDGEQLEVASR